MQAFLCSADSIRGAKIRIHSFKILNEIFQNEVVTISYPSQVVYSIFFVEMKGEIFFIENLLEYSRAIVTQVSIVAHGPLINESELWKCFLSPSTQILQICIRT